MVRRVTESKVEFKIGTRQSPVAQLLPTFFENHIHLFIGSFIIFSRLFCWQERGVEANRFWRHNVAQVVHILVCLLSLSQRTTILCSGFSRFLIATGTGLSGASSTRHYRRFIEAEDGKYDCIIEHGLRFSSAKVT